jgi:hypothetical protein
MTAERNIASASATRLTAQPAQINEMVLTDAAVVLVDGRFMDACQAWSRAARARGIHVVLDGGSWKEGSDELLKDIDTAICSAVAAESCRFRGTREWMK